jgi:SNF family Na+-dependent transporter
MGIWVDAFVQVFYQISIACGTVINFSSMKKRR